VIREEPRGKGLYQWRGETMGMCVGTYWAWRAKGQDSKGTNKEGMGGFHWGTLKGDLKGSDESHHSACGGSRRSEDGPQDPS